MHARSLSLYGFLWLFSLTVSTLYAQQLLDQKVSISISNQSLVNTLKFLSEKSGIPLSYSRDLIPSDKKINIKARKKRLEIILDELLSENGLAFKEIGRQVVIYPTSKEEHQNTKSILPPIRKKYTISGYLTDEESGEKLIQAQVYDLRSLKGTMTNNYGFFSLSLVEDSVKLVASYTAGQAKKLSFMLSADTSLSIALPSYYEMQEVEIVSVELENIAYQTSMSRNQLPIKQIKRMPTFLGETDAIKAVQMLPGVQSGGEGSTGLYVRGGGPDQNLVLLDGAPIYHVSHLGGFFSIFNPDALNQMSLIKGGFPARYGGRLSSVLDIRMKEGNMKKIHGEAKTSLLSTKFSIEGPLIKDQSSFMVSFRRSFFDLFSRTISRLASRGSSLLGYAFSDFNAKINHKLTPKDRIYLSTYIGSDRFVAKYEDERFTDTGIYEDITKNQIAWGNRLVAFRWNHLWSPKMFSNFTATYTRYRFRTEIDASAKLLQENPPEPELYFTQYVSGIQDWALRFDMEYYPNTKHQLKFGTNVTKHYFTPGVRTILNTSISQDTTFGSFQTRSLEAFTYIEDHWEVARWLGINLGLHASSYWVEGETYLSLEPRISTRILLGKRLALKASFAQMTQYLHLLSNSGINLPIDLWVPATENVPPQRSSQLAGGFAYHFSNQLEFTIEGYYKQMYDLIELKEGASFVRDDRNWQDKIEKGGKGLAYGVEFFLQKKTGKTSGWLGYTLAWNYRTFERLNEGKRFPYRYDRRHDVSFVIAHELSERLSISANWVYGTGNAVTLATGKYSSIPGANIPPNSNGAGINSLDIHTFEGGRNGFRMRPYHRLDIGLNISRKRPWGESNWNLSFYNAYNRKNPFFYYFAQDSSPRNTQNQPKTELKQYSLFPILPSASYRIKF